MGEKAGAAAQIGVGEAGCGENRKGDLYKPLRKTPTSPS